MGITPKDANAADQALDLMESGSDMALMRMTARTAGYVSVMSVRVVRCQPVITACQRAGSDGIIGIAICGNAGELNWSGLKCNFDPVDVGTFVGTDTSLGSVSLFSSSSYAGLSSPLLGTKYQDTLTPSELKRAMRDLELLFRCHPMSVQKSLQWR